MEANLTIGADCVVLCRVRRKNPSTETSERINLCLNSAESLVGYSYTMLRSKVQFI